MMLRLLSTIGRAFAVLLVFAVLPYGVAAQAVPSDPLSSLFAYAGAVATSAALGAVKGLDLRVTNAPLFRKLQPVITLGGAFLVPWVAQHAGVPIDPGALASAPVATIATITAAELLSLVFKRRPSRYVGG